MVTIVIKHHIIKTNYFIWYTDTLMKNLLNFENELIEYKKNREFDGKKWVGMG